MEKITSEGFYSWGEKRRRHNPAQISREGIRTQKYLGKKLLPSHLMHYSSFPGRINVEKTSEQCFRPPLPPENQKAVGGETETQVRS